jgi:hypothetical protein
VSPTGGNPSLSERDVRDKLLQDVLPTDPALPITLSSQLIGSGSNSASSEVTAGFGTLKAKSFAQFAPDASEGFAHSESLAIVFETALVTSTTGEPDMTPVTLTFNLSVTGTSTTPNPAEESDFTAGAVGTLIVGSPFSPDLILTFTSNPDDEDIVTAQYDTFVGATIPLYYSLATITKVTGTSLQDIAQADYSNSLHFSLIPLEAGVKVTTFGGQEFTAAVPEPQTWLLLGAGLLVLTAWSVRRRAA